MINSDSNHPQIDRKFTLFGLFGFATAYAWILSTEQGKRWADNQTWATVVAGVGLTSAFIALEDRKAAQLNFIYFFVAGVPIIFRSLWLQLEKWESKVQQYMPSAKGDNAS